MSPSLLKDLLAMEALLGPIKRTDPAPRPERKREPNPYDLDNFADWRKLVQDYGCEAEEMFRERVPEQAHLSKPMTADEARAILFKRHGAPI